MQSKWLYGFGLVKRLIEELDLSQDKRILNLGCGFGKTAKYITQEFGCSVIACDILKKNIEKAESRALRDGWAHRVKFKVLDYQNLTLEKEFYDIILVENVTTFVKNKRNATEAYSQALKSRGKIGIVELMWYKNPSGELSDGIRTRFGFEASFFTDKGWRNLFGMSGLELVKNYVCRLSLLQKGLDDFRDSVFESLSELLRTMNTVIREPVARRIALDFLRLYMDYSGFLGLALYVYSKT